ncbi:MAG: RsmE family RNA methyltransferase [Acidimicrobiales bacterium]
MGVDPELRTRPLVFVDDLDHPVLEPPDHHHLARARRVVDGAEITLADGRGGWRTARFGIRPTVVGPIGCSPSPSPPLLVAFSPVKGDKPEWFVQKLTELGIDDIVPVVTERSVVRWDTTRSAKLTERLGVVAREACMQSRRLHLPTVWPPIELAELRRRHPLIVLADPAGPPLGPPHTAVVIGPEGGFASAELAGSVTVTLPGNVLRAGTAAVTAGALMCAFRDGWPSS